MECEWHETYRILKQKHDEAFTAIEMGKKGEERDNNDVAIINYKLCISLIDDALAAPVALPEDPDDVDETWRLGLKIVQSLKRMRAEVLRRIAMLSATSAIEQPTNGCKPKESVSPETNESTHRPRTFAELAEELQTLKYDSVNGENLPSVLELLFLCEGAKLYHIANNGEVTTTDESSTLRIVRLDQDVVQKLDATYFMQIIHSSDAEEIQEQDDSEMSDTGSFVNLQDELIEDGAVADEAMPSAKKSRSNTPPKQRDRSLIYPLVPGVSPCFRTEFGAFIFPDTSEQGAAYGIVIPSPADEIVLEILDGILHGVVRQQPNQFEEIIEEGEELTEEDEAARRAGAADSTSERISENIIQGACLISHGLVKGTEQVGKMISYTTPFILSKMRKGPDDAPISNKVSTGVGIAKVASAGALGLTSFVANKVGCATMSLGRFLAPHVHTQGSKLLSKTVGYSSDEAQNKMSGVLTVAAGAVEGFGTVYDGLDKSARILGQNLSENSVKIIEHKYGSTASNVATDAFDTVGNMINLGKTIRIITPAGLAKKTVKATGTAIVTDFKPKPQNTHYVTAGTLYPDLTEFSKKLSEPKALP